MVSFHSDILGWISGKTCVMGHHGQHICCLFSGWPTLKREFFPGDLLPNFQGFPGDFLQNFHDFSGASRIFLKIQKMFSFQN